MPLGHVLCPYRPGARGDRALRAATQLVARDDAKLSVVLMREASDAARACCGITPGHWERLLDDADREDARQAREIVNSELPLARVVVLRGASAPELICGYARDEHCDVIALAARSLLPGGGGLPRRTLRRTRKSARCEVIELDG